MWGEAAFEALFWVAEAVWELLPEGRRDTGDDPAKVPVPATEHHERPTGRES